MKTTVLPNGIHVCVEQSDVKMFYIDILVRSGAIYEDESNLGISHFIEHMLFKGTKTRTSKELLDSLKSIGVNITASTSQTYTCYSASCLEKDFFNLLYDLGDMLSCPAFNPQDVKSEAKVILEEYYASQDDLNDIIYTKMYKTGYRNTKRKNMVLGNISSIKSMSAKRIREFYTKYYVGSNIYISVVSPLSTDKVIDYLWSCFGSISKGSAAKPVKSEFLGQAVKIFYGGNTTPCIDLSFDASPQSLFGFEDAMLCDILDKRMYDEIRDKRSLAYKADVAIEQDQIDGILVFDVSASSPNIRQCIEVFAHETKLLKTSFCSDQEIAQAKNKARRSITAVLDSPSKRCGFYCMQQFMYNKVYSAEEMINNILSIKPKDILLSAQRILGSECLYVFCGEKRDFIPYKDVCEMLKL